MFNSWLHLCRDAVHIGNCLQAADLTLSVAWSRAFISCVPAGRSFRNQGWFMMPAMLMRFEGSAVSICFNRSLHATDTCTNTRQAGRPNRTLSLPSTDTSQHKETDIVRAYLGRQNEVCADDAAKHQLHATNALHLFEKQATP